jgi:pilus assembly protein CpaE
MATILVIDDDNNTRRILSAILTPLGYQVITAENGVQGMNTVQASLPDLIITDVVMPGIDGYELTRRLRRDARCADLPILILTGRSGLEEKLKGFEAGANDYLTKPCEPAELAARVKALFRQAEKIKQMQPAVPPTEAAVPAAAVEAVAEGPKPDLARVIAVHSLRGGVGCSTLSVNLAVGLTGIWTNPALLMDLVMNAGQIALFLDTPLKRTWADLAAIGKDEVDGDVLISVTSQHGSGLHVIAAPTYPVEGANLTGAHLNSALRLLRPRYDYIVADLPHDFGDLALQILDTADIILLILAPELASLRAASAALETYSKLGYPAEKIKLIMNCTFPWSGINRKNIESVLHQPLELVIPFVPEKFTRAINKGQPLLLHDPEDPACVILENYAYAVSMEKQKKFPPLHPSPAWKRVFKRVPKSGAKQKK